MDLVRGTTHAGPSHADLAEAKRNRRSVEFELVRDRTKTGETLSGIVTMLSPPSGEGMFMLTLQVAGQADLDLMGHDLRRGGCTAPYNFQVMD